MHKGRNLKGGKGQPLTEDKDKAKPNHRFERDFCYAAAPQKPLKLADSSKVSHGNYIIYYLNYRPCCFTVYSVVNHFSPWLGAQHTSVLCCYSIRFFEQAIYAGQSIPLCKNLCDKQREGIFNLRNDFDSYCNFIPYCIGHCIHCCSYTSKKTLIRFFNLTLLFQRSVKNRAR